MYLNKTGEPESSRGRHLASGSSPSPAGKIFCVKAASTMPWARATALDSASSRSLILHPHTYTPTPSMTPWGSPKPANHNHPRTEPLSRCCWYGGVFESSPTLGLRPLRGPTQVRTALARMAAAFFLPEAPRPPTPGKQPDLSDYSHPKGMSLVKHLRNRGALGGLQSN